MKASPGRRQEAALSEREWRALGSDLGWPALHCITASSGFVAERVAWHRHDGHELLLVLGGAAQYEFHGGQRLSVAGGRFLLVPPAMRHRSVGDVRSPTVHSSITLDLAALGRGGGLFAPAEARWLRAQIGVERPTVRAMSPSLRRQARELHRALGQSRGALRLPEQALVLRLLAARILVEAARVGEAQANEQETGVVPAAIAHFERHLTAPVQMDAVASALRCSRAKFYSDFKRETGMSPNDWLLRRRVEKAGVLLAATPLAVKEIAAAVGFSSHAYFCQVFRKYTGRTPGQVRRG